MRLPGPSPSRRTKGSVSSRPGEHGRDGPYGLGAAARREDEFAGGRDLPCPDEQALYSGEVELIRGPLNEDEMAAHEEALGDAHVECRVHRVGGPSPAPASLVLPEIGGRHRAPVVGDVDLAGALEAVGVDEEGGMRRVDELVLPGEAIEEGRQVVLGQGMKLQTRLVEEQDRVRVPLLRLHEEDEVEAQEPLQACAAPLQLDLLRAAIVGDVDTEVVAVRDEAEAVVALLPPLAELSSSAWSRRPGGG